jgi:hypothetical protein
MNILKRLWKKLWSKTEVDDIVIERAKRVKEELKDVGASLKEVANQAGDVVDAAKGKKRNEARKDYPQHHMTLYYEDGQVTTMEPLNREEKYV